LLKKDEIVEPKHLDAWKKSYSTKEIPYYKEFQKNTKVKYRIHPREMHMEFYINLLESFCMKGENVINVYMGSKFMIASKVRALFCLRVIFKPKMSIGLRLLSSGQR